MAITTTTRKATLPGTARRPFSPFAFKVFLPTDLYVVTVDESGNLVLLVLGTDYSAVLNADRNTSPGGSV